MSKGGAKGAGEHAVGGSALASAGAPRTDSSVLVAVLNAAGWVLARLPTPAVAGVAWVLGEVVWRIPGRRGRTVRANLRHAFPDRAPAWRRSVGRESCRRAVETALLAVALPHLSAARAGRILTADAEAHAVWTRVSGGGGIFAVPHLAPWEALTLLPPIAGVGDRCGAVYRPLDNPVLDAWVRRGRGRFGLQLFSRKRELATALRFVRGGGWLGVLFDQNAGDAGVLSVFLGRVCSVSEMVESFAERTGVPVVAIRARRLGCWRYVVVLEEVRAPGGVGGGGMTLAVDAWLEERLRADEEVARSWLWLHDRWRNQDVPARRFRLEQRKSLLGSPAFASRHGELPRRTELWVRIPNWLGDVSMAVPLLRAIRAGRPDMRVTSVGRAAYGPLLERLGVVDRHLALPGGGIGRWREVLRWRAEYPETWLALTNSLRGDLEGWLVGAPQRFGLVRPGRPRPLLRRGWRVPDDLQGAEVHQTQLWERMLQAHGLREPADRRPITGEFPGRSEGQERRFGLLCGSSNDPAKRWPVAAWRELATGLLKAWTPVRLAFFGTAADRPIADAVAEAVPASAVENLAGATDMVGLASELRSCDAVFANDSGGLHLANLLGVPVVGLYGPTNPLRTGPVFDAPVLLLKPAGTSATGGRPLADLSAAEVLARFGAWWPALGEAAAVRRAGGGDA